MIKWNEYKIMIIKFYILSIYIYVLSVFSSLSLRKKTVTFEVAGHKYINIYFLNQIQ